VNHGHCDGADSACELLHRHAYRGLLEAHGPTIWLLAGSRGQPVPVACEEAYPGTAMSGAHKIDTIVDSDGQGVSAAGTSLSAVVSGIAEGKRFT